MSLDFTGKVVLVTGGTRGVGRGIADAFVQAGAQVVVCGRRPPDLVPTGVTFLRADVRETEQVQRLVAEIVARFGGIDVLVNNAGGSPMAGTSTASPRFHRAVIALNLTAPLELSAAAYPSLAARRGNIVNIASVSALRPSPGTAAYGAAKAGLLSLTRTLAVEWAPDVRVNAVVCGLLRTELAELHYGDAAGQAAAAETVPLGRLGSPADVASACLYLASAAAPWITGACLEVHGGGERPAFLLAVRATSGNPS
jgi:NAD(P)-dependent dehydrogenase (short-subunit alcohol dehydrogenase family)